jgi:hypothetical protein
MTVDEVVPEKKRIFVQVPKDVRVGVTKLRIEGDGKKDLLVTVPAEAGPEDMLILTEVIREDKKSWQISIVPSEVAKKHCLLDGKPDGQSPCVNKAPVIPAFDERSYGAGEQIGLYQVSVDPARSFLRLVDALRAAGAYVNEKLGRMAIPPSGMVGIIAEDTIQQGEIIARIPGFLHISKKTVPERMPELYTHLEQLEGFLHTYEDDMRVAACVTKLLAEAAQRYTSQTEVSPEDDVCNVWSFYIELLLGEDFEKHPYWRWVADGRQVVADMWPSPEGPHAEQMAAETLRSFKIIQQSVPEDVLGSKFDAGLFLHARLSMLSRVFHTRPDLPSLVPLVDLFNHSSDATCDWAFDSHDDVMLLTSNRVHAAGEQLWISYGMRSNPILFRTYGFTIPPRMEPSWSYVLQISKPLTVYAKYLPEEYLGTALHLDTRLVQDSFIASLNACAQSGHDAADFVFDLCSHLRRDYDSDAMLQPALCALRRARLKLPRSASWWDEMETAVGHFGDDAVWKEACMNCKMSEYLCLTAHIEICEWFAGRLPEERCLEGSATIRPLLAEAFRQLREYGSFTLVTTPLVLRDPA